MTTDELILKTIRSLVRDRYALRTEHALPFGDPGTLVGRLQELDGELDQFWDLLRQRRALRAAGGDPTSATVRPVTQVQAYRQ